MMGFCKVHYQHRKLCVLPSLATIALQVKKPLEVPVPSPWVHPQGMLTEARHRRITLSELYAEVPFHSLWLWLVSMVMMKESWTRLLLTSHMMEEGMLQVDVERRAKQQVWMELFV